MAFTAEQFRLSPQFLLMNTWRKNFFMNENVIARIKLTAGQIGYFDDLTQIYLTHQNPVADVLAGMNCTTLVNAVRDGKICVIEGSITQNSRVKRLFKLPQITISAEKAVVDDDNAEKEIQEVVEEKTQTGETVAVVQEQEVNDADIETEELVPESKTVKLTSKGETYTLEGFENASFVSSDTSVVTITKKGGKITAKSNGETTVVASIPDGDVTINVVVDIPEDVVEEVKEEQ